MFLAGFTGVDDRPDVVGHVWPRVALPSVEKSLRYAGVSGMEGADHLWPQRLRNDDSVAAKDKNACSGDGQLVQDGRVRTRWMLRRQVGRRATGLQDSYDGLKILIGGVAAAKALMAGSSTNSSSSSSGTSSAVTAETGKRLSASAMTLFLPAKYSTSKL
jgi:hypothetical protein